MNQTFKITSLRVFPQLGAHDSVIAKAEWMVIFERDGFTSTGAGMTLFDVDSIQAFTPFDQVTKEQIVAWVIARGGGQPFIDALRAFHSGMIDAQEVDAQTQSVSPPYVEPQPRPPTIATDYVATRQSMYPRVEEQLDMLWHAMDDYSTPRIEPFYSTVKAVKDASPKPEVGTVFAVGPV